MPVGRPIRDGHKLVLTLGPDFSLKVDIDCPGCNLWHESVALEDREAERCWLRYFVRGAGSEFLEWWTGPGEAIPLNGPIEIEWWVDGGDEPEVWWRPVTVGD